MKSFESIYAGWLIDGSGGFVQKNVLMRICDGKISSICKKNPFDLETSRIMDLSSCTLLPGLNDSHVHLIMSGTTDPGIRTSQLNMEFDDIKPTISHHLDQLFSYGVIGIRDGGDARGHGMRYKIECHDEKSVPVSIRVVGKAWRNHGRYGKLIGRPPGKKTSLALAILHQADHIDQVKIVNSGLNSLADFARETKPQFSLHVMRDAVKAAKKMGCKVMVHANGKEPVKIAVEAGCDSIEHGFFMGKENLRLMAEKKIVWIPTAFTMKAYSGILDKNSAASDIARRNYEHQVEQIALAKDIGVIIALGTDSGSPGVHHGSAVVEEIQMFLDAGFSIQEAIKNASYNGAKLLNQKQKGMLAGGLPATFIAVSGSPSKLPGSLDSIKHVCIDGVFYQNKTNCRLI